MTFDFLGNGVSVDLDRKKRTFKGDIGKIKIISRKISFILISAHHRMR
jgi:hypothetical protein